MSLNITGHYPEINQTDVYRNETVRVYFDRPIKPSTVTWETLSVHDKDTFSTTPGSLGVVYNSSGDVSEATFLPSNNFVANSKYSVYVYGAPSSIVAEDDTQLEESYTFEFTVGTGLYDSTESGGVPSGSESTTWDSELTDIYDQSTITSFDVYTTEPKNQSPNNPVSNSGIYITFTGNISTDISEISGYISIEENPVI